MVKVFKGLLVLLVVGLLLAGVGVAMSWAPDRPVESLTARWAPAPSTFIDVEGLKVHLRDEGPRDDAEPIVLLHGTSASLHTWDGWAEQLKGALLAADRAVPTFAVLAVHFIAPIRHALRGSVSKRPPLCGRLVCWSGSVLCIWPNRALKRTATPRA